MAEYTQEPQEQAPMGVSLPLFAPGIITGEATVLPRPTGLAEVLLDGAGVVLLPITLPAMASGLFVVDSSTVSSLRDAYLGGENCPPTLTYPIWGQRGSRWVQRTQPI